LQTLFFLILFASFFPPSPLFSSSFAGCKDVTFLLNYQVLFFTYFLAFFLVNKSSNNNAFFLKRSQMYRVFGYLQKDFYIN
jgi:hypothetical protein